MYNYVGRGVSDGNDVGILCHIVDSKDTVSVDDVELDEAIVSPVTPRVLDEPVVGHLVGVDEHAAGISLLLFARVPPLGHVALWRSRVGAITANEANNSDCVVKRLVGTVLVKDHTRLVQLEGTATGIDGYRDWLLHDSVLHVLYSSLDLSKVGDFSDNIFVLVETLSFRGLVSSGGDINSTLLLEELVSVSHPGTLATVTTVVFAEKAFTLGGKIWVVIATKGAIKKVLLGEVGRRGKVSLFGESTFNN